MTSRALTGKLLDARYHVARLLREDDTTSTSIFEAMDVRVGTRLEIEVLSAEHEAWSPAARALELRAGLQAELAHPSIVAPRDVGVLEDGSPYVVRARREGHTLDDRICLSGPLATIDVVRVALELLSALAAAHEKGVHHGAIAPEHVVVVERDSVLLGVALDGFGSDIPRIDDAAPLGFSRHAFVAPERLDAATSSDGAATVASDLYALAAVLVFAATGCAPETIHRGAGSFGLLPTRIARVLRRAMHPEPDHRFGSAQELIGTFLALRDEVNDAAEEPLTRRAERSSGMFMPADYDEHTVTETSALRRTAT